MSLMIPKIWHKEFLLVACIIYQTCFVCLPNMHKDTFTAQIAVDLFVVHLIAIQLQVSSKDQYTCQLAATFC